MIPIFDYVYENNKETNDENVLKVLTEHLKEFPDYPIAVKCSSFSDNTICENSLQMLSTISKDQIYIDAEGFSTKVIPPDLSNLNGFSKTYQMYKKGEIDILQKDIETYDNGIGYKLVRGAYWHEDKHSGLLYTNKKDTDKQYNDSIELTKDLNNVLYATHNEKSLSLVPQGKKVAQLMGMADKLSEEMTKTHIVHKYVPFGSFSESIPYLLRRLYENLDALKHF
tara:strand:+ start:838 stop:1512 length:675 start_codon:yes stop_codon:yes gene_type:complete